jgi:hypothetical protein
MTNYVSHIYKTTGKAIVLYTFMFLDSKLKEKRFCIESKAYTQEIL